MLIGDKQKHMRWLKWINRRLVPKIDVFNIYSKYSEKIYIKNIQISPVCRKKTIINIDVSMFSISIHLQGGQGNFFTHLMNQSPNAMRMLSPFYGLAIFWTTNCSVGVATGEAGEVVKILNIFKDTQFFPDTPCTPTLFPRWAWWSRWPQSFCR